MALPTSGQMAASAINVELGRGSTSTISIDTAENGGYGAINQSSTSRPSATNPAYFSEWRGYDHNAGGPFGFEQRLGYDASSFDRACINVANGRTGRYRTETQEFPPANLLYRDINGTSFAAAGWYADGFSGIVKYWNGSSFTQERFCRV